MKWRERIQNSLDAISDRFFKPTNEQMLQSAAEHGADLSKSTVFTFYLAFKNLHDANEVAGELSEKGYKVCHETDGEGDPFPHEIEASVSFIPSITAIEKCEDLFKSLVGQYAARYEEYSIDYGIEDLNFFGEGE